MGVLTIKSAVLALVLLLSSAPAGFLAAETGTGGVGTADGASGELTGPSGSGETGGGPIFGEGVAAADEDPGEGNFTWMPYDGDFQDYHTYEDVSTELQELAAEHRDIATLRDIAMWTEFGATWGGRSVWAMKISDDPGFEDPDEPDVLIIGNHHAREVMSVEVPMYFIHYLLDNYDRAPTDNDGDGLRDEDPLNGEDDDGDGYTDEDWSEAQARWLVENREIWVVPMLNPDGTTYSQELSQPGGDGGSWRKNIRDNNRNGRFDPRFDGVDLNRNYPYKWDNPLSLEGSSADSDIPTSDVYRGPRDNFDQDGDSVLPPALQRLDPHDSKRQDFIDDNVDEDPWDFFDNDGDGLMDEDKDGGFTEPETRALEELMVRLDPDGDNHNRNSDVPVAISYHSYSGLVLWPWGYTNELSPDEALMEYIGGEMGTMTGYLPESASELYLASGDCTDWLYGAHGTLAYTIELNTGAEGGFQPATPYIVNTSRLNLQCNLYISEVAAIADYARINGMSGLDVDIPFINHTQQRSMVSGITWYPVEAVVTNPHLIVPGSVELHYSTDGGETFRTVGMKEGDGGRYIGRVPPLSDGMVRYYVSAQFSYTDGEREKTITVTAPRYAPGDYFEYEVNSKLGMSAGDIAALVLGMAFFFSITWGGFARTIQLALTAEKRKTGHY